MWGKQPGACCCGVRGRPPRSVKNSALRSVSGEEWRRREEKKNKNCADRRMAVFAETVVESPKLREEECLGSWEMLSCSELRIHGGGSGWQRAVR